MSEIIQTWLSAQVGVILDLNLLSFGEIAKDGNLMALVLNHYGILSSDDLERIHKTENYEYALRNLMFLNNFFKTLGIDYSRKKLEAIAKGDGMMALRLFYQLYLLLNDKDKLYFITNKVASDKNAVQADITAPCSDEKIPKSLPGSVSDLNTATAVYNWHRNNYLEQFFKCREIRQKYLDQFQNLIRQRHQGIMEQQTPAQKIKKEYYLDKYDSDSDIVNVEIILEKFPITCETSIDKAKEYVSNLKQKSQKFISEKKLQAFMHKIFMNNLLETLLERQRNEFNEIISKKLLKQSYYEKQMESKLLEIRRQKDVIIQNRALEHELYLKKQDEKFVSELYQQRHNVAFANLRTERERQRILDLHRKLYAQKQARKQIRHLEMARIIVEDIYKLAMKTLDYKEMYDCDVPKNLWRDWMALFFCEQELCEPIENVDELLEEEAEGDVFSMELYKQNLLDEKDIKDYVNFEWPWNIDELIDMYNNTIEAIKLGQNVLGFAVHRVLFGKYPYPLSGCYNPLLPKVKTAACIVGITDDGISSVLDKVLKKKHILVVHMQNAINYCLDAYNKEKPEEEPEKKEKVKEENPGKNGKDKKGKDKKEKKEKKEPKGKKQLLSEPEPPKGMEFKETQTPKLFPGEEFEFSSKAKLGAFAFEAMKRGQPLNERLVANMFVEYLQSLKKLKGWVLINYPEDVSAAIALECVLTGKYLCYEGEENESVDEEYDITDDVFAEPDDLFEENRISKLVPYVVQYEEPKPPRSYMNSFIYLKKKKTTDAEDSGKEIVPSKKTHQLKEVRDFYKKLGCDNSMHYSALEPDVINEIVAMITKDDVFGKDIYDEILKLIVETLDMKKRKALEELENKNAAGKEKKDKNDKGKNGKKDKKEKKESKDDKKGKDKNDAESTDDKKDKDKIPERIEPTPSPLEIVIPPKPGEEKWEYVKLPILPDILVNLATFWENMEEIYLNDFKQVFFLKRLCQNAIIPYTHKIFTHMTNYIERPDRKQEYLYKFQLTYNELDNDLREDDEFKAEMHCRINEFKTKLWDICMGKMRDSEAERCRIIAESWFFEQAATFLTIYNSALQLELDHCANTYYFLQDYYSSMTPMGLTDNKFNRSVVKKYELNDKDKQFLITTYTDINANIENNPFVVFLNTSLQESTSMVASWYSAACGNLKKIVGSIGGGGKGKSPMGKKKAPDTKTQPLSPEEIAKDAMMQEWQTALDGENLRVLYRLHLINAKARCDLYELLLSGETLFHELYSKLYKRYHDELNSVNECMAVLQRAVEACESIQPRLIFDGPNFIIGKNELLYDDPLEIPTVFKDDIAQIFKEKEELYETHFTIAQLNKIADMFFKISPRDSIPTKAFTYILQDMVAHYPENNEESIVPNNWRILTPAKVQEIVSNLFGRVEYLSWKDFIIYNLEIPFPTEMELQTTRHQFRLLDPDRLEFVNETQFHSVDFWFEGIIDYPIKKKFIKILLAKLFRICDDRINYAMMLLHFSKDKDPIIGAAKAFGLSMGKLVCWDEEIGRNYIEILEYQKYMKTQDAQQLQKDKDSLSMKSSKSVSRVSQQGEKSMIKDDLSEFNMQYGRVASILYEEEIMEEEIIPEFLPQLSYTLPFEVVLMILTAALPWHYRIELTQDNKLKETLELMYESVRNDEFNCVFSHEFLNSQVFKNYLDQSLKFVALSPAEMIEYELELCKCAKEKSSMSMLL